MQIKVEFLNSIEIHRLPCVRSKNPTVLIVGGVHGNEPQSMKGSRLLVDYLSNPDEDLTREILERINVVVVPVINTVGHLAGARACPTPDILVEYIDGKVVVQDDEKRTLKFPPGWQDANREWEDNQTLVKYNLSWLISVLNPAIIIFNHDWALTQGRIKIYGPPEKSMSDLQSILECFFPSSDILGNPWSLVLIADREEDSSNMGYLLGKDQGIEIYLTEVCVGEDHSPRITLAMNLFMLAKAAEVPWRDSEVISVILEHLGHDGRHWSSWK